MTSNVMSTGNIRHSKPNDTVKGRPNTPELYLWKPNPISMLLQCNLPVG